MSTATASRGTADLVVSNDRVKRVNAMNNSVKKATDVHKQKPNSTSKSHHAQTRCIYARNI